MTACPHGMPSPASCYDCMEEGPVVASRPPRAAAGVRPPSMEGEHDEQVYRVIVAAGTGGLGLDEIAEATGLRRRVLENVVWRLSVRQNRVHRVPESRPLRYAPGGSPG